MKPFRFLICLILLVACAPIGIDQVRMLPPTETHHVAQLPPAWTDTPMAVEIPEKTSTPTASAEAATATSTMAPVTPDPNAAQILFMQTGECTAMSISTSGGSVTPLTLTPPADCASSKISPNGEQIAYFGESQNTTIFLANVDGSEATTLVQIEHFEVEDLLMPALDLIWSPKGRWLAVVSESAYLTRYADLYLIEPDGSRELQYVAQGPIDPFSSPWVSWSPDEKWLTYYCLISYMGSEPDSIPIVQRVTDSHYNVIQHFDGFFPGNHFEWSPDSKSLAIIFEMVPFSLSEGEIPQDQQGMTIATPSTGEETKHKFVLLPTLGATNGWGVWDGRFGIHWAPDGNSFLALQRQSQTLSILNADGTLRNTVLSIPAVPLEAGWSPDGEWIYYITASGSLEIVRPDGTDLRTLANGVAAGSIVWK